MEDGSGAAWEFLMSPCTLCFCFCPFQAVSGEGCSFKISAEYVPRALCLCCYALCLCAPVGSELAPQPLDALCQLAMTNDSGEAWYDDVQRTNVVHEMGHRRPAVWKSTVPLLWRHTNTVLAASQCNSEGLASPHLPLPTPHGNLNHAFVRLKVAPVLSASSSKPAQDRTRNLRCTRLDGPTQRAASSWG